MLEKNNELMQDKNGRTMKTGDIVKIENAYFKNDNGYYYIDRTPGDASWLGSDYSLHKISKRGKISTAKYHLAFWPLSSYCSDRMKNAAAHEHNKKYATIEVVFDIDRAEVIAHFEEETNKSEEAAKTWAWRFGEDSETAQKEKRIAAFHRATVERMKAEDAAAQNETAPEPETMPEASAQNETTKTSEQDAPAQVSLFDFLGEGSPEESETQNAPEEIAAMQNEIAPEALPESKTEPETTPEASAQNEATPSPAPVKYYDISEETARRAWYAVHMGDYKKDSATNEYRASVDNAAEIAAAQKRKVSQFYHDKIDRLLDRYAYRLAKWYNDYNRNEASCPSWFISGPAKYPVRKHEKKMNRERSLWAEYDEIKALVDKIKSVGTGPIDLADPHAREMLQERLDSLQKELERDKVLNAYWRKHKTFIGCPELSASYAEKLTAEINEMLNRCAWITKPFPDYELTSLRDKIKRTEERLAELDRREAAQESGDTSNQKFEGGEIIRNTILDRLQIIFDSIPDEETRTALKQNGFRWSPKNKAWQRQLTNNAEYALQRLNLVPQN